MAIKYLFKLLFVLGVCSCSNNLPKEHKDEKYFGNYYEKRFGISIENGQRQGFQYFDSMGVEYNYRYITTTITNDSLIPIRLLISFSKEYNYLRSNSSLKSKVFLLPRELTPYRQHFDNSMSKELKQFLDTDVHIPITLDKIINANEELVMTFAVLTPIKYGEYMNMELILSDQQFYLNAHDSIKNLIKAPANASTIYLGLNLVNSFIIPCGKISFSK